MSLAIRFLKWNCCKQEGVYAYNRDTSAGEYIPDKNSSSKLSEYLRVHCNVEGATNVTFSSSGNPLWVTRDELVSDINSQLAAKTNVAGGLMGYDDAHAHITDAVAHMTQAQKDTLASAIQNATIGGTAVPKSGSTLQLPAYPTSLPANGGHAASADTAAWANGAADSSNTETIANALTVTTSEPPGTLGVGKLWGVY